MKHLLGKIAAILMMTAALSASSYAAVGVAPPVGSGPALQDGAWLNGVAGGSNFSYQYGITAAGTTQATATQLPANTYLLEVDTTASGTGVNLPPCLSGTSNVLYNNGASTLTVYPAVANNPITGSQDTINNGTTLSGGLATHAQISFACIKPGVWSAS